MSTPAPIREIRCDRLRAERTLRALVLALAAALVVALAPGCASGPPPTPTELGWAALEQGDWRSAKTHFAEALRLDARDGRAWHGQAKAQLAGRDPESALRSLGSLAKADGERFRTGARDTYADALDAAAERRLRAKQSEGALAAVRALTQLEPKRRGLVRLTGAALVAEADRLRLRGQRDAALALYREACEVTPSTLDAWVGAVEILLEKRKGKQAMAMLEAARRTHPTAGAIRTLTLQALRLR